jgi:hypothetical protein
MTPDEIAALRKEAEHLLASIPGATCGVLMEPQEVVWLLDNLRPEAVAPPIADYDEIEDCDLLRSEIVAALDADLDIDAALGLAGAPQ